MSGFKPLLSLLCGGGALNSLTSRNGFRDILFWRLLSVGASSEAGEAARLRKGLFEDRLTERPWALPN